MKNKTVAVLGLGYVGLPLAVAFGRVMPTIGYDLSQKKVDAYKKGFDPTGEVEGQKFKEAKHIQYTTDPKDLSKADFVVAAVPTPVDESNRPDLSPMVSASETIGKNLKKGAIVIFESTVYPGATEEVCLPILEKLSGLKCGVDFKIGYSPERINPGDKVHTLETIVKVVAGMDQESLDQIAWLYEQVVTAGVHRAPNIKVAEAAKVIENTQRDLNIALINELSIIFHKVGIDTLDVLTAAGTKWNFLPFRPGLVGGHCIGVDPYYLTHKAETLGYNPQVILAGRRINDGMGAYIAENTIKKMIASGCEMKNSPILVMGITFKEDCPDVRNSKVIDIITELKAYGANILVWDPVADADEVRHEYGVELCDINDLKQVNAIIAAVAHKEIKSLDLQKIRKFTKAGTPFIDVKSAFDRIALKEAGFDFWRL
ncbi:MAG: nucleotide sugar dehydrogenase [Oligoflexia bacterium]|nr:nucleotide sugar dehydrogenase [Oligoflexia bacterium]